MGECIMRECYTDAEALHYAQWQMAVFRLPLAQQDGSGWWDAPPWLSGLCPWDFMDHTKASGAKDFQTMRQEKTLALAHALQTCAERSGTLTGVLCSSVKELQRCIASLMCLSGDEIVEASLLDPTGEEDRTSPAPEEETALLGEEPKPPETPKATSLPECLEIPEATEPSEWIIAQPVEATKQTDTPSASPSPSPTPKPSCYPSQKIKKSQ